MAPFQSVNKVVLCTGANRGLGLAILQVAGLQDPSTVFILSCRRIDSGDAAKEQLVKEGIKAYIEVVQLDTTDDDDILEAVKFVESKYGKLDGRSITLEERTSISLIRRDIHTRAVLLPKCLTINVSHRALTGHHSTHQ